MKTSNTHIIQPFCKLLQVEKQQFIFLCMLFFLSFTCRSQDFILSFNTTLDDPTGTTIILPISEGAYDVDFNNDGVYGDIDAAAKLLDNLTGTQTITFPSAGSYTIRIRPNSSNTSKELRIAYSNTNSAQKLTSIDQWGNIIWTSMKSAFKGCSNMNISASAGAPNLSLVTSMEEMFSQATSFNQDLSAWDVSNVTNMNSLFSGASIFNGNITTWNTENVIRIGCWIDMETIQ
jgi:surface protein